jgi:hypothetical protein
MLLLILLLCINIVVDILMNIVNTKICSQEIDGDSELVCVHDSARPLVSSEDVKKVTNQQKILPCNFQLIFFLSIFFMHDSSDN